MFGYSLFASLDNHGAAAYRNPVFQRDCCNVDNGYAAPIAGVVLLLKQSRQDGSSVPLPLPAKPFLPFHVH